MITGDELLEIMCEPTYGDMLDRLFGAALTEQGFTKEIPEKVGRYRVAKLAEDRILEIELIELGPNRSHLPGVWFQYLGPLSKAVEV